MPSSNQTTSLSSRSLRMGGSHLCVSSDQPLSDSLGNCRQGLSRTARTRAPSVGGRLLEETGFPARSITLLGTTLPCTGRLSNKIHSFFVETEEQAADFVPERGLTARLVTSVELRRMIIEGEFTSQLHLGALLLAQLHSCLSLDSGSPTGEGSGIQR